MSRALDRKMDKILVREQSRRAKTSYRSRAFRKILANRLSVFGFVVFIVSLIMCYLAPLFTSLSATTIDLRMRLTGPSAAHILGTDQIGRDVFARILYGGQISIGVGLGAAIGTTIIGVAVGVYAGYVRGWLDAIMMKISEIMMSFPQIVLVLILVAIAGRSLWNLIFIFVATGWPSTYRMVRAQMLSIREEEYVQALRAFGVGRFRVSFKHMLPNAVGPIFVNITLSTAMFILQEAALSFLGLGVPQDQPTWGNILNAAQDITILRNAWWVWLPVGLVITVFVLAINFIGDGMRDAADPTQIG